jgi:hypothetical protein
MPLDKQNMTVASRIMLPAYVLVFGWVGLNWLVTPLDRLHESPGLQFLDLMVNLRGVGLVLVIAGALIALALATTRRDMARYALILAGTCMSLLLVAFLIAPFFSSASPSAGAWPFLGVCACLASYRSVTVYEVR